MFINVFWPCNNLCGVFFFNSVLVFQVSVLTLCYNIIQHNGLYGVFIYGVPVRKSKCDVDIATYAAVFPKDGNSNRA